MKRKVASVLDFRKLAYDEGRTKKPPTISSLPFVIDPSGQHKGLMLRVEKRGSSFVQRGIMWEPEAATDNPKRKLSAPNLLRAFYQAQTESEVQAFLTICGPFMGPVLPQKVTMAQFVACKNLISDLHLGIPRLRIVDFISLEILGNVLDPQVEIITRHPYGFPRMTLMPTTALEVIGAALLLNRLNGTRSKKCEWEKCDVVFDLENDHSRRGCEKAHTQQLLKKESRKASANAKRAIKEAANAKA